MNHTVKRLLKWSGAVLALILLFVLSIYTTMSSLIRGSEIQTPNWIGKTVQVAFEESKQKNVQLMPIEGSRLTEGKPFVITRQFPEAGVTIKKYGFIKIYYTPRPEHLVMPDVRQISLDDAIKRLSDNGLRKGAISYMDNDQLAVDFVISQSVYPGESIVRGDEVNLLVSRGIRPYSFIMPDFIGLSKARVEEFLLKHGLKIARIETLSYPGLEAGVVVKQYPHSGFRINARNLITLGVSE